MSAFVDQRFVNVGDRTHENSSDACTVYGSISSLGISSSVLFHFFCPLFRHSAFVREFVREFFFSLPFLDLLLFFMFTFEMAVE